MTFQTAVENERYTISGQFHSSSLVDIVREVSADSTVSGRMSGGTMSPERYVLDYKSGKRNHVYEVLFAGGNVVETKVTPERPKPDSWVPVPPADLRSVFDPIGALLIPGNADVCGQRLPVFDGGYPLIGSWVVGDRACGMGLREDASRITQDLSRFKPHFMEG